MKMKHLFYFDYCNRPLITINYKRVIETWFDEQYKEYFYTREPLAKYLDMVNKFLFYQNIIFMIFFSVLGRHFRAIGIERASKVQEFPMVYG